MLINQGLIADGTTPSVRLCILFLLIPSRNVPNLTKCFNLVHIDLLELNQGIFVDVIGMPACFHSLKAPILGESCVAQPNQKRMQAHKS